MIIQPPYVLDANNFIEASRRYYQFGFAKPFWDGLLKFAGNGKLYSIDKVLAELKNGNKSEPLYKWATNDFSSHFHTTQSNEVIKAYSELVQWAGAEKQYLQRAKDRFMEEDNADAWVVAYAKAHGCTVVTHEVGSADVKKNIPIPNVCDAFDIPYCDTFTMLDKLGFGF